VRDVLIVTDVLIVSDVLIVRALCNEIRC